ncbi:hypothetical protein WT83_27595 [Burkholderia territorii]|uniref:Uncharacterized protein n=1 Tax=Burkholderia territorii TaxID=1503055 RepID=A0A119VDM3_9BURK|nr:hypothetical protein WT83_27595 [Burkholderia territorii]
MRESVNAIVCANPQGETDRFAVAIVLVVSDDLLRWQLELHACGPCPRGSLRIRALDDGTIQRVVGMQVGIANDA